MAELLKFLSETNGVSGNEHAVRELIIAQIRDKADELTVDTMGNIIAFKRGKKSGKTIAVTANIDEAGFIISEITEKGYLKFKLVGDIDPRKLVSKKVIIADKVKGVIGMKAIHLQTADERKNVVKVKDLFIDIGAKDKEEAEKSVRLGNFGTFITEYAQIGENIKGKALGRSGACYALIKALEREYPYNFYAVFTVQHEVGARGAKIVAHRVNPDVILTVSSAETKDMYGCEQVSMAVGKGVAVNYADRSVMADKALTDRMTELSKKTGIAVQPQVLRPYSSDGGAMQIVNAKVISAVIPCRYNSSPVSLMSVYDIEQTEQFIELFLNKIGDMI